ncbi:lipopolysaccharide biosynthesis protein [Pseudomonas sp. S5D5]|uniref:lipopolysaccharide biosynthesis protein n=1 Tax=Pseudomonas sp. S5D5 TaxID=2083056 RepID=UPI000D10BEAF|nr:lipopolysaccharide biosynthesis protein [Pseudomonas sp. S5D5]
MKQMSFVETEHAGAAKDALYARLSGPRHANASQQAVHDFDSCRNIESGAVFIIASGLSAKSFPFETFAHVPMITMNGAVSMFLNTDIQPFFYACTDRSFSKQQPDLFKYAMATSKRVALWEDHAQSSRARPTGQLYRLTKAKRPSWLDATMGRHAALVADHSLLAMRKRPVGFSKDMSKGFFDARTVAYLAIQLAYHAGFTKVFLVGVDLHENSGRFYETQDSVKSPCGLDEHYETRILPSLELMSRKVMGNDFMVYNFSDCSRIPESVIPRVTLGEVEAMLQ